MDKSLLTPWFDGRVKPTRRGVYMLMSGSGTMVGFQLWHGKKWGPWFNTIDGAARTKPGNYCSPTRQNDKWRGLTELGATGRAHAARGKP